MAKVKIYLDKDENLEKVESDLYKAMGHHASGAVHDSESFKDPAMKDVAEHLEELHSEMYKNMLREIIQALEDDFRRDYGN